MFHTWDHQCVINKIRPFPELDTVGEILKNTFCDHIDMYF